MPPEQQKAKANPPKDYEALLRQVSERVWALWRADLRRAQERSGKIGRRSK